MYFIFALLPQSATVSWSIDILFLVKTRAHFRLYIDYELIDMKFFQLVEVRKRWKKQSSLLTTTDMRDVKMNIVWEE